MSSSCVALNFKHCLHFGFVIFLLCVAQHILFVSSLTAANKSSAIMSTHIIACLLLYRHRQVSLALFHLAAFFLHVVFLRFHLLFNFLLLIRLLHIVLPPLHQPRWSKCHLTLHGGNECLCWRSCSSCTLCQHLYTLVVDFCPLPAHWCKCLKVKSTTSICLSVLRNCPVLHIIHFRPV